MYSRRRGVRGWGWLAPPHLPANKATPSLHHHQEEGEGYTTLLYSTQTSIPNIFGGRLCKILHLALVSPQKYITNLVRGGLDQRTMLLIASSRVRDVIYGSNLA